MLAEGMIPQLDKGTCRAATFLGRSPQLGADYAGRAELVEARLSFYVLTDTNFSHYLV